MNFALSEHIKSTACLASPVAVLTATRIGKSHCPAHRLSEGNAKREGGRSGFSAQLCRAKPRTSHKRLHSSAPTAPLPWEALRQTVERVSETLSGAQQALASLPAGFPPGICPDWLDQGLIPRSKDSFACSKGNTAQFMPLIPAVLLEDPHAAASP